MPAPHSGSGHFHVRLPHKLVVCITGTGTRDAGSRTPFVREAPERTCSVGERVRGVGWYLSSSTRGMDPTTAKTETALGRFAGREGGIDPTTFKQRNRIPTELFGYSITIKSVGRSMDPTTREGGATLGDLSAVRHGSHNEESERPKGGLSRESSTTEDGRQRPGRVRTGKTG